MSVRTRAGLRGLVALAAVAGMGTACLTPAAAQQRQQGQRPAQPQPAPQPAPAQPPAGQPGAQGANTGPMVVQVKAEPSQADWTKVCGKDPSNSAEICYTTRDFVSDQGQPVLAAAVYDVKGGQNQKIVRFLMPLGLMVQPGVRFAVDQGQAIDGKYQVCFPNGCFAEAAVKDDTINQLKRGTNLNVSVQNQVGRVVTFAVPLAGFGKAFDGPAIDPKVLEEQQKKLQEELQKRSDEMRKRLEQGAAAGGTPGSAPAGAPAAPR